MMISGGAGATWEHSQSSSVYQHPSFPTLRPRLSRVSDCERPNRERTLLEGFHGSDALVSQAHTGAQAQKSTSWEFPTDGTAD